MRLLKSRSFWLLVVFALLAVQLSPAIAAEDEEDATPATTEDEVANSQNDVQTALADSAAKLKTQTAEGDEEEEGEFSKSSNTGSQDAETEDEEETKQEEQADKEEQVKEELADAEEKLTAEEAKVNEEEGNAKPTSTGEDIEEPEEKKGEPQPENAEATAAAPAKPLEGEQLTDAVQGAELMQEFGQKADKVISKEVKEGEAVELASGDADVSTTGACREDVFKLCLDLRPGEGRLGDCLTWQLKEQEGEGYQGEFISEECKKEVEAFKVERSQHINADVALAKACKDDVSKHCGDADEKERPGAIVACLRNKKPEVSDVCKEQIFRTQVENADDWRTDPELSKACAKDVEIRCPKVEPIGGKVQECLHGFENALSWECRDQLSRQEVEGADDARLSVRLFHKCLDDKKRYCPDVKPGNARVFSCLEENREDPAFSPACKGELEKVMERRAADFRLDFKLRESCNDEIKDLCFGALDDEEGMAEDDSVIKCLQDFKEEINSDACQAQVHRVTALAAQDIRFDVPLAEACYDDRQKFCTNVPPGSARVIRCLQDRREQLSYSCKAMLFDHEVITAENIDFQFPMKTSCRKEIKQFCANVPKGEQRVIRCLMDNQEQGGFSEECKTEVKRFEQLSGKDFRLNSVLRSKCKDTITSLCPDKCKPDQQDQLCGGSVLQCLVDGYEKITEDDCKNEVFYFMKMEVRDFRNDVFAAEMCRDDVTKFCADIEPGEGRVHACLQDHRAELSEGCRKEEVKLQIMQASNIELKSSLLKTCTSERRVHCSDVRPGKSRVYNCLLSKAEQVDFSIQCKEALLKLQKRRMRDWRLDYNLKQACKDDVPRLCADKVAEVESKGNGAVFTCLVKNADLLDEDCTREVQRAVSIALLFYQKDLPVVGNCDADVHRLCLDTKEHEDVPIGAVRKCLMERVEQEVANILEQVDGNPLTDAEPVASAHATGEHPDVIAKKDAEAQAAESETQEEEAPKEEEAAADEKKDDAPVEEAKEEAPEEEKQEEDKGSRRRLQAMWRALQAAEAEADSNKLSPECDAVARLAANVDLLQIYQTELATSDVMAKLSGLKKRMAGLPEPVFGDSESGLVLSGWWALGGIVAVAFLVLAAGAFVYQQYTGINPVNYLRGYTIVVPKGQQAPPAAAGVV